MRGMYPNINKELKGRKLEDIELSGDKQTLTIKVDGVEHRYGVEGDCCSTSWIEHLEIPDGIIGSEILDCEELSMGDSEENKSHCEQCKQSDCLSVYQVLIKTTKGTATLEFRNDSNGYYGGNLYRA